MNVGQQVALLLLERVHDGYVTERFGTYFDDGERIWYWAKYAISGLIVARWVELIYPAGSPARQMDFVPLGLEPCAQLGLTEADATRRVILTERGKREYQQLRERAESSAGDRREGETGEALREAPRCSGGDLR